MEEINYKYQLFNARILFFVFINILWLIINNLLLAGKWTVFAYLYFGSGLLVIDFIIFPYLINLFKRDGIIILSEDELIFKYLRTEKKIKAENVSRVTYNIMSTMNVKFGMLTVELKEGKYIKIYFEDIDDDNEEFYFAIYKRIEKYQKN